jgi:prolyl 4-hydroxylase
MLPPIFSDPPFKKIKVPEDLYSKIMNEYRSMPFDQIKSEVEYSPEWDTYTVSGISVSSSVLPFYNFSQISTSLYDECYKILTPILEKWCGYELENTYGYGIRSYVNNSVLHLHRDRYDTHIISCIIFVDEKSDEQWPLDFFDHNHVHHKVTFDPGEMLLYESLCAHGRLSPFKGSYYRNMYFHWKPKIWQPEEYSDLKTIFKNKEEYMEYYR